MPNLLRPRDNERAAMSTVTLYHNPRCSKSRAALALLEERGAKPRIVEYLKTPLSAAELESLVKKLGIAAEQLVRKSEEIYKIRYAGRSLSEGQWIKAMAEHPILIERPIAVKGAKAVIGRPPENVTTLL
jgi:arsenate reductase (glutaredoxin)